jgi:hypothetical protein
MTSDTRRLACAFAVVLASFVGAPARAQDPSAGQATVAPTSREAQIAAEQAQKAAQIKPYEPSGAERWAVRLRREFLTDPNGFYPYFGSVYSGGGFTLGAGYRQYYADRTHFDVKGLYSFKGYKLIELSTDSWGVARERLDLHARVGWRDATQVAYYGLGIDSPNDRADFRMKETYFGGDVRARPGGYTVFGAGMMYEDYSLEEPTGTHPPVEEVHTPETAPGLGVSPTYLHTMVSAGVDWRPSPGYARRGGLYEISYHNYADRDETYSFDRVDGEIVQHIPILRENWVVSLHGLVQTTLDDDDNVPYFLMPSLGSGSTLRAYPSWRYRDRHSLLLQGEFRWIPNRMGLDMALFYDMGKVTPRWDDLSLSHLKSDVGLGVRFHGPFATPLRIELAHGREGLHLVFAGSAAF